MFTSLRRLTAFAIVVALFGAACSAVGAGDTTLPPPDEVTTTAVPSAPVAEATTTTIASPAVTTTSTTSTTTTTLPMRAEGEVPAWTVGEPWGEVKGLTMFRGNPTRTFYGSGPIPQQQPRVLWRFPESPMCGTSSVAGEAKQWCGSGWTGQPVVWERDDGVTEVIFGAYDKRIHFLDADTGERLRSGFFMGDIIKGSVTLDPDGFPLVYAGSRDPNFRIIALDGDEPTELWSLPASAVSGMWNNDWDSNAVIIDDVLFLGGENSWWFAVGLNRGYDAAGKVTVDPEILYSTPAWTEELVGRVGRQQSVESSTAVFGTTAYFANSAGRVVGVDTSQVRSGEGAIVFDFWMGDDVDSTIVIDDEGMLYVSAEVDLNTARGREVGQVVKLDPSRPDDPLVWRVAVPATTVDGGIWATPALVGSVLFVPTNPGDLLAVDTKTGEVLWSDEIGVNAWSSPVHVDDTLVVAVNCEPNPALRAYDVSDPSLPQLLWELPVGGGCIESTPAVWNGRLYVGSRDGYFYAIGE